MVRLRAERREKARSMVGRRISTIGGGGEDQKGGGSRLGVLPSIPGVDVSLPIDYFRGASGQSWLRDDDETTEMLLTAAHTVHGGHKEAEPERPWWVSSEAVGEFPEEKRELRKASAWHRADRDQENPGIFGMQLRWW